MTGEGDCLILGDFQGKSNGSEKILLRNILFQGQVDFLQPTERSCLAYQETFPEEPFEFDHVLIADVKHNVCPGRHSICGLAAGVVNPSMDAFDAHLPVFSPAINAGTNDGTPARDFDHFLRDTQPDIGAYEWRRRLSVYLPLLRHPVPRRMNP